MDAVHPSISRRVIPLEQNAEKAFSIYARHNHEK
jgi:hypothetical protein